MKNTQEKLLGNSFSRFIANEKEIIRLQNLDKMNSYQIIVLCMENLKLLHVCKDENFTSIWDDDELQIDLIKKEGFYYLSTYNALSAIENPTEQDKLDKVKYRAFALEYCPEQVTQIDSAEIKLEKIKKEQSQLQLSMRILH